MDFLVLGTFLVLLGLELPWIEFEVKFCFDFSLNFNFVWAFLSVSIILFALVEGNLK